MWSYTCNVTVTEVHYNCTKCCCIEQQGADQVTLQDSSCLDNTIWCTDVIYDDLVCQGTSYHAVHFGPNISSNFMASFFFLFKRSRAFVWLMKTEHNFPFEMHKTSFTLPGNLSTIWIVYLPHLNGLACMFQPLSEELWRNFRALFLHRRLGSPYLSCPYMGFWSSVTRTLVITQSSSIHWTDVSLFLAVCSVTGWGTHWISHWDLLLFVLYLSNFSFTFCLMKGRKLSHK